MVKIADCHLCGKNRPLQRSHVWPAFAYRHFIADQSRGGSFCDLAEMRFSNRQMQYEWFCESCERRFEESYASRLLKRILKNPTQHHTYDGRLVQFAVSMSLRVAKFYMPGAVSQFHRDILKRPCRVWRDFLLDERRDVRPFSLHAFIHCGDEIDGETMAWYTTMGGEVFADEKLILSRVGPLLIVGLLERRQLSRFEREVWSLSELSEDGGELIPISKTHPQIALTDSLVQVLNDTEKSIIQKIARVRE